tara:strand:- start:3973 stop:4413 length:441 start_codon:yes stop_codon:yes gene_type:complete
MIQHQAVILGVLALAAPATAGPEGRYSERQILDAIRQVESGGRDDCPDGDGGRSIGPYQVQRAYWEDATSFDPSLGGTYQDCRKRGYAEKVIRAYMRRYVSAAWTRLDAERIARTHNGGPRGASKTSTIAYWKKVQAELQKSKPRN